MTDERFVLLAPLSDHGFTYVASIPNEAAETMVRASPYMEDAEQRGGFVHNGRLYGKVGLRLTLPSSPIELWLYNDGNHCLITPE